MGSVFEKVMGYMGLMEEVEIPDDMADEKFKEGYREAPEDLLGTKKKKGTVVNIHTQKQMRVVVVEPLGFEEVQYIADHLKSHRPVIVNLEGADAELAKRIVDFMSGTTYALNGSMQKIGEGIFLFTPSNIEIDTDQQVPYTERKFLNWVK